MVNYKENDTVSGVVTGIEKYGIFVALEDGYTGLIHISEISPSFVQDANKYAQVGDKIECKVLEVDKKNKKLVLSIKYQNETFKESGSGFLPLKEKLDGWIKEKL